MDTKILIEKYNQGLLQSVEIELLEQYIEQGKIELEDLHDVQQFQEQSFEVSTVPSAILRNRFYQHLLVEKEKLERPSKIAAWQVFLQKFWSNRLVYGAMMLLLGFGISWWIHGSQMDHPQIVQLSDEVSEMRELMMLSMLEQESTSERIKAVNLTREMPEASDKVTAALLKTLNEDENTNVRLVTIEALLPYTDDAKVRKGLVQAIRYQDSPMVQIALAEVMVALQEKRSVEELRSLLKREELPIEVKETIEESIETLL